MDRLDQMATFVRIVETGSLSAAARQLRLSAAAVSRQLAQLERRLGATLVLRTTRRLSVTAAGQAYYQRCLELLRELDEAEAVVRSRSQVAGRLTVSAPVTYGVERLVPHLPALLRRHPGLELDLRLEDRLIDLVEDGVDLAVRAGIAAPDSGGLVSHLLDRYRRQLVAAPAYLRRQGTPRRPEALAEHEANQHLPASGSPVVWRFVKGSDEVMVRLSGRLRMTSLYGVRDATLAGAGVAVLPSWMVEGPLGRGELRALLPGWAVEPTVTVVALHRVELRGTQRVRVLLEHLRTALATA